MTLDHYLIETTLGNIVVTQEHPLYAKANSTQFLKKDVTDISCGEMLLYPKKYVTTELDDVIPYLSQSPRYVKARDMMHEKNSHGEDIPKLRCNLIRGLARQGVISTDDLEKKIMREDRADFSREEYRAMERAVREHLSRYEDDTVELKTIDYWLRGFTYSAGEWPTYRSLESLNPAFREWKESEDPTSLYFNYRLFCTIHSGIMRFLNNCKGTTVPTKDEHRRESRISISPECQIVLDAMMKGYDEDSVLGKVTNITRLGGPSEIERARKNKNAARGMETQEVELIDYTSFLQEQWVIHSYLFACIEELLDFPAVYTPASQQEAAKKYFLRFDILKKLLQTFYDEKDPIIPYLSKADDKKRVEKDRKTMADTLEQKRRSLGEDGQITEKVYNQFLMGDVDTRYNFPRGTALRLVYTASQTFVTIPWGIRKYMSAVLAVKGHPLHASPHALKKMRERIKNKYDVSFNPQGTFQRYCFLSDFAWSTGTDQRVMHVGKFIENNRSSIQPGILQEGISQLPSCKGIFTRKRIVPLLEKYRLGGIIDVRRRDFLLDELVEQLHLG